MESIVSDNERNLYSLTMRDIGLRILILEESASVNYETLKAITPRVAAMINEGDVLPDKTLHNY